MHSQFKVMKDQDKLKAWADELVTLFDLTIDHVKHTTYQIYEPENGKFATYYGLEFFYL